MIRLDQTTDDNPLLNQSKLFYVLEQTMRYVEDNNGIGLNHLPPAGMIRSVLWLSYATCSE
ncbi:hypothetical protein [Tateyamaria sp.]|uniref:hypothetical protein n=1 Tax=Tateyamaria sp. TaxID=1929288 RepID=UPI00329DF10A